METHPIPQQISSYQFRLVGDMTLKQFFQVAGGALVSLLFYASKLNPIIKWPFIIFFALLGVALAFLPFEDRPLETWILSFFRSIYSPTIFNWKKIRTIPEFFQEEAVPPEEKVVAPQGQEKLKEYLSTTSEGAIPFFKKLDLAEKDFLSSIRSLFSSGGSVKESAAINEEPISNIPKAFSSTLPTTPFLYKPKIVVEEKPFPSKSSEFSTTGVTPTFKTQEQKVSLGAEFSLEAAPPNPPTVPNTIVGQVMDTARKIIEGSILEVRDSSGRPVRALKSNKVGHFIVVTPLQNGRYEIFAEKEGFIFNPVHFEARGEIIPPIAIKGKAQIKPIVTEVTGQNIQAKINN